MKLPDALRDAIDSLVQVRDQRALTRAAEQLTERYKRGDFSTPAVSTAEHRAAYLLLRMPATFSASSAALSRLRDALPDFAPETMLDLGAGPGTASWAAAEVFPTIRTFTFVERDANMIDTGRQLASHAQGALASAEWVRADLGSPLPSGPFDLVTLSYSLNEMARAGRDLVKRAWGIAKVLVIVEPGTRPGFANVDAARSLLIGAGAQLVAPCPHHNPCPMAAAGDWCHFAVRLERSAVQRRLKQGSLGYEDEKFSYVIAAREDIERPDARVVRHPMRHSGYTQLTLCTADGLEQETVTKSDKKRYRAAKKTEWGDAWSRIQECGPENN